MVVSVSAVLQTNQASTPSSSEHCDRVERRPRPADDPQRCRGEEELPAPVARARLGQLVKLEIVQQGNTHGGERKYMHRKADGLGGAGCGVAIAVGAEHGNGSLEEEGRGAGMQPGLCIRRVPRAEFGEPAGMAGADQEDVARAHSYPLRTLGELQI